MGALAALRTLIDGATRAGTVSSLPGATLALFGDEGHYNVHAVPLEPRFAEARLLLVIEDLSAAALARGSALARREAGHHRHARGRRRARDRHAARRDPRARRVHPRQARRQRRAAQRAGSSIIIEQIDVSARPSASCSTSRARGPSAAVAPVRAGAGRARRRELSLRPAAQGGARRRRAADGCRRWPADPRQLQQVLVNLLMNALDACAAGRPRHRRARAARRRPACEIAVARRRLRHPARAPAVGASIRSSPPRSAARAPASASPSPPTSSRTTAAARHRQRTVGRGTTVRVAGLRARPRTRMKRANARILVVDDDARWPTSSPTSSATPATHAESPAVGAEAIAALRQKAGVRRRHHRPAHGRRRRPRRARRRARRRPDAAGASS